MKTTQDVQARGTASMEETRAAWDAIAPGYDAHVTPTGDWALPEEALRLAGVRAGTRFLDVASGSGALALPAARMGARVTAVDISPAMVERLRARARAEGLASVDGRVMDGHALELPGDAFDVAGSQFGVMLFPDLPRGVREMVRVTRPGGRVFLTAFASPDRVEFLTFFVRAMTRAVPGFPGLPDEPMLPFQVADPATLRHELEAAGLADVRAESSVERLEFADGEAMWAWLVNSNPIAVGLVADLDDDAKAAVRRELDALLRERAGGDGRAVLTAAVHIGIGTVPG